MKLSKICNRFLFVFNLCIIGALIIGAVSIYRIVNPPLPKIDNPAVLLEQILPLFKDNTLPTDEYGTIPPGKWPPALQALNPRYVFLNNLKNSDGADMPKVVDVVISTGGALNGNRGYLIYFGSVPEQINSDKSSHIFANEIATVFCYENNH